MRLGIDCLTIDSSYKGGINTYLFGLLDGFLSLQSDVNTYIIFCHTNNAHVFKKYAQNSKFEIVFIDQYGSFLKKLFLVFPYLLASTVLWRNAMNLYGKIKGINRIIENNCDVLYTATTVLNIYNLKIPTILSMHDIQQYHYPQYFTKKELTLRKLIFVNSAKAATLFQASSMFIKNDLLKNFEWLKKEQIVVIPEGVDLDEFSKKRDGGIREKYSLPSRFLFFPAQLWKHKNHITVLKGLKKLENENVIVPMVMSGASYSASQEILDFIKINNMYYVYNLGKIGFQDILTLYQKASFLITAVLYESSSLPILEAAASGTAIIASKTPPNIEMSKNLKMSLFEPLDTDECARVIMESWSLNQANIDDQVNQNRENIKQYSWDNVAQNYVNFLQKKINVG
jgi:glycosyltransferase involved in cell wall biosynthesis